MAGHSVSETLHPRPPGCNTLEKHVNEREYDGKYVLVLGERVGPHPPRSGIGVERGRHIEELIMGHEDELTTEELQEILNEEHQETCLLLNKR
ncbi:hypothetical protein TNCV_1664971 [Trichonephila clavipes]|uniref:Uncharacterized protein n=1 Tax=Trichonephila clavipes TaxID=2585209 RepID=A0A8X6VA43_TRICX|nr:hypothetical protein TNCV_1664971 [Trichonephila clavipes]